MEMEINGVSHDGNDIIDFKIALAQLSIELLEDNITPDTIDNIRTSILYDSGDKEELYMMVIRLLIKKTYEEYRTINNVNSIKDVLHKFKERYVMLIEYDLFFPPNIIEGILASRLIPYRIEYMELYMEYISTLYEFFLEEPTTNRGAICLYYALQSCSNGMVFSSEEYSDYGKKIYSSVIEFGAQRLTLLIKDSILARGI